MLQPVVQHRLHLVADNLCIDWQDVVRAGYLFGLQGKSLAILP